MKKKIISMALAFSLAFSVVGQTAIAKDNTANNGLIKLNSTQIKEYVKDVALEWAETIKPDVDFNLGEVSKINVVDSNISEYTVSYFLNALPYGYAVVVFQNNEPIVKEANVNPGQEGIYTDLVDTVIDVTDTSRKNLDIDKQIVELAPMQYGVSAKNKHSKAKKVYDNYGNEMSLNEVMNKSTKYENAGSIFIKNFSSNKYKVSEKNILKKYTNKSKLFTEDKIEKIAKKYCCVIQASLQIAYMEGLLNNTDKDIKNTYNKLWNDASVSETTESKKNKQKNKIIYGETTTYKAKKALEKLAKSKGYKSTTNWFTKNKPSVSWIKDNIQNNRSILMGYGINVGGKRSGHEISVLGLIRAKKVSSGNTWNYLMVYNSWNNYPVYINYSTVDFMDCDAAYFSVKK